MASEASSAEEVVVQRHRGLFFVIEGKDRSGKSTQADLLVQRLRSNAHVSVKLMHFPDMSTPVGKLIDHYARFNSSMDPHVMHLLLSANVWELSETIRKTLESGVSVVLDRYFYWAVAFSVARKGLDLEWCLKPFVGLPKPDWIFYLDCSDEEILARCGMKEDLYGHTEVRAGVHEKFMYLLSVYRIGYTNVMGTDPRETVASTIYGRVSEYYRSLARSKKVHRFLPTIDW